MNSVLIIYTGGTIGMKTNPETGALTPFKFDQIESEVPELKKFGIKVETYTFNPIIDSSNVTPKLWCELAEIIKSNYNKHTGFVILHGTDTMAYTASAISFMMQNLDKPIIFTGSQIPIGVLRTDGKENLITAVEIACATKENRARVPEVCIYFQNKLFRANRTTKYSADHFNAFRSHNYPSLADVGIDINYKDIYIRKVDSFMPKFDITTNLTTQIAVIRLFPGIMQESVIPILNSDDIKGVVIQSYGSGNAPQLSWLLDALKRSVNRGVLIINVTQCNSGSVNMSIYETGKELLDIGVINGQNITIEAAITKLMYILCLPLENKQMQELLSLPIRGEMG